MASSPLRAKPLHDVTDGKGQATRLADLVAWHADDRAVRRRAARGTRANGKAITRAFTTAFGAARSEPERIPMTSRQLAPYGGLARRSRTFVTDLLAGGTTAVGRQLFPAAAAWYRAELNERFLAFPRDAAADHRPSVRDATAPLARLTAARARPGTRTNLRLRTGARPWTSVPGFTTRALSTVPALAQVGATDLADELTGLILAERSAQRGGLDRAVARFLLDAASADQTDGLRPLFEAFAQVPAEPLELAPAELIRTTEWIDAERFRDYVSGKSIALVANSMKLREAELGALIDSHDLVMRFNSFVIDPPHTGSRTDIHVTLHKHDFNLDVPVDLRMLVCTRIEEWHASVKHRPRPGMQRYLADSGLRWPRQNLWSDSDSRTRVRIPTMGFHMLRFLLALDVSTSIDLVGFDFYDSGPLRLKEAEWIPHSTAHDSEAERDWVMANAVAVGPHVITMKQESAR